MKIKFLAWTLSILFIQIYSGDYFIACDDGVIKTEEANEDHKLLGISRPAIYAMVDSEYWNWDIFHLIEIESDKFLRMMVMKVWAQWGLFKSFPMISRSDVNNFVMKVEQKYQTKPSRWKTINYFNNGIRAADILQTIFAFIKITDLQSIYNPNEFLGIILAAIFSKFEHPGTDNEYELNAIKDTNQDEKFIIEKRIKDAAINFLRETKFLTGISSSSLNIVQSIIEACIIDGAISAHTSVLDIVYSYVSPNSTTKLSWYGNTYDLKKITTVWFHLADLSYPGKPWKIYREWMVRRMKEYIRLSVAKNNTEDKLEEELKNFNEESQDVAEAESYFLSEIMFELFGRATQLVDFIHEKENLGNKYPKPWMQNLLENKAIWERLRRKSANKEQKKN